jgi:hypothetical protein
MNSAKHPASFNRRAVAAALTLLLAGIGVHAVAQTASAPRRYATMSLVGDQLTAVERREQTGTRLDRNLATEVKVNGDILDRAALGVVNELIVKADAGAKPLALLVDEPVLYQQQARLFDGNKFVRLPTSLAQAAKAGGATHLLLISKQRANLNFRFLDIAAGQGSASGLGFYVEPNLRVRDYDLSQSTQGFLGLYVHVRATVVDLATEAIVGDRDIVLTDIYANTGANARGALPWDALSASEKAKAIGALMMQALRDNVPALLKSA